jgi:hypothetical protein
MQQEGDADIHFPRDTVSEAGHEARATAALGIRSQSALMEEPEPRADHTLLTLWKQRCEVAQTDGHATNKISLSRSAAQLVYFTDESGHEADYTKIIISKGSCLVCTHFAHFLIFLSLFKS